MKNKYEIDNERTGAICELEFTYGSEEGIYKGYVNAEIRNQAGDYYRIKGIEFDEKTKAKEEVVNDFRDITAMIAKDYMNMKILYSLTGGNKGSVIEAGRAGKKIRIDRERKNNKLDFTVSIGDKALSYDYRTDTADTGHEREVKYVLGVYDKACESSGKDLMFFYNFDKNLRGSVELVYKYDEEKNRNVSMNRMYDTDIGAEYGIKTRLEGDNFVEDAHITLKDLVGKRKVRDEVFVVKNCDGENAEKLVNGFINKYRRDDTVLKGIKSREQWNDKAAKIFEEGIREYEKKKPFIKDKKAREMDALMHVVIDRDVRDTFLKGKKDICEIVMEDNGKTKLEKISDMMGNGRVIILLQRSVKGKNGKDLWKFHTDFNRASMKEFVKQWDSARGRKVVKEKKRGKKI